MSTRTELQPRFVEYDAGGTRPLRELTPDDRIGAALHEGHLQTREQILAMPSLEEGLNLQAVDEYRQEMGAPERPYRFLTPDNYQLASSLVDKKNDHTSAGSYLHFGDVIIVKRDPELEKETGPGFMESLLVHELAHGSNEWDLTKVDIATKKRFLRKRETQVTHSPARLGQVVMKGHQDEGTFIEEGYAEYERGRFIVNKLGLPNGFTKNPAPGDFVQRINKYAVPKQGNKDEGFGAYGWAAMTVELLAEYDPDLLQAFRDARHSAKGLRDVAQSIDSAEPGLYRDLRKIDIHADGANKDAQAAFERVYRTIY